MKGAEAARAKAEAEKEGVFAAIYDAFNERTRYYV